MLAFAAPIKARDGRTIAALSVPFIAGVTIERMETIRLAVMDTASEISAAMPA